MINLHRTAQWYHMCLETLHHTHIETPFLHLLYYEKQIDPSIIRHAVLSTLDAVQHNTSSTEVNKCLVLFLAYSTCWCNFRQQDKSIWNVGFDTSSIDQHKLLELLELLELFAQNLFFFCVCLCVCVFH